MMEEGKKINFYRLGLENGRRYRMELTDEYRLTGTGGGVSCIWRQFMTPEIGMDPGIDWFWRAIFIVANMKYWSWRPMRI